MPLKIIGPQIKMPIWTKMLTVFIITYLSYFFLTGLVFGMSVAFFIILINFGLQDYTYWFFRFFSFILPQVAEEKFSINFGDIMKIFLLIALIISLGKTIYLNFSEKSKGKIKVGTKKWFIFLVVAVIYVITALSIIFKDATEMYLVVGIFFIITLLSGSLYFFLNKLERFILNKI